MSLFICISYEILRSNRSTDPIPSQHDLNQFLENSNGIRILIAIVDELHDISFFRIDTLLSEDWISSAPIVK